MTHTRRPGYFMVKETGQTFRYRDIVFNESSIAMETIEKAIGVSKPTLLCLCNPIEPVPMHFQRHRKSDTVAHFWDNRGNHFNHASDCPRAKSDDVQRSSKMRETTPGVEWNEDEQGNIHADVNIDPFAVEVERAIKEVSATLDTAEGAESAEALEKSHATVAHGVSRARGQSKFGGLVRTWYELGRAYAVAEARTRDGQPVLASDMTFKTLIWAMMRVLFLDKPSDRFRFTIRDEAASKFAFVPYKKAEQLRKNGESRIVLGRLGNVKKTHSGARCTVEGVNAEWDVFVPTELTEGLSETMKGTLVAFRAVFNTTSFVATHKAFLMRIAEPGAVWVESEYESRTYAELRRRNFNIEKPARETEEFFGYRPDFVLRGFSKPVVIEVYGMRGVEAYDAHKDAKREVYAKAMQQGLIIYLEWDVTLKSSWNQFFADIERLANATG